ncbi:uncharacterized protein BDZ99DRAFT_219075 [Mytilinidion resinicola]|uniref:Uncharacterized protein n=1 Tax=Mytilinidion resinicola TaxID=574789 RepID=A0A6A6XYT4_9PEZI|nr:uncharacterized protein BDZ99DRAFT_219075 [Mytilinidion resinicola]KAF2801539.1 hypothetical protein BDZ99DRAFT_219075 [Mytilinidion resinicola]
MLTLPHEAPTWMKSSPIPLLTTSMMLLMMESHSLLWWEGSRPDGLRCWGRRRAVSSPDRYKCRRSGIGTSRALLLRGSLTSPSKFAPLSPLTRLVGLLCTKYSVPDAHSVSYKGRAERFLKSPMYRQIVAAETSRNRPVCSLAMSSDYLGILSYAFTAAMITAPDQNTTKISEDISTKLLNTAPVHLFTFGK